MPEAVHDQRAWHVSGSPMIVCDVYGQKWTLISRNISVPQFLFEHTWTSFNVSHHHYGITRERRWEELHGRQCSLSWDGYFTNVRGRRPFIKTNFGRRRSSDMSSDISLTTLTFHRQSWGPVNTHDPRSWTSFMKDRSHITYSGCHARNWTDSSVFLDDRPWISSGLASVVHGSVHDTAYKTSIQIKSGRKPYHKQRYLLMAGLSETNVHRML